MVEISTMIMATFTAVLTAIFVNFITGPIYSGGCMQKMENVETEVEKLVKAMNKSCDGSDIELNKFLKFSEEMEELRIEENKPCKNCEPNGYLVAVEHNCKNTYRTHITSCKKVIDDFEKLEGGKDYEIRIKSRSGSKAKLEIQNQY